MHEKLLEEIGLTKGEIVVYETLLKIGESTTGKIIEESKLSSGKIYEILNRLIQKGLASYIIKDKVKYFSASSPNRILDYVKQKGLELKERERRIRDILPSLLKLQRAEKQEYSVRIFKGIEGIKTVLQEVLNYSSKKDEWLAMAVAPKKSEDLINNMWRHWHSERAKKGISAKIIVTEKSSLIFFNDYKKIEIKLLEGFAHASISVIGEMVIIYTWQELSALLIHNKEIAQTFRDMFLNLWKLSNKA